jgi:DNA mismatch repair ATPase MutL
LYLSRSVFTSQHSSTHLVLAVIARTSEVKQGDKLSQEEMKALIKD